MAVLREKNSGGFSVCKSDENHVGKGRCNHIHGICFEVDSDFKSLKIKVGEVDSDPKILKDYLEQIGDCIPEEKKQKIIEFCESFA